MKPQTTGLLLCALLMSTFGHELLARHQVAHALRDQTQPPGISNPSAGEVCITVCHYNSASGSLEVSINATTGTIAVTNTTAHVTLIIDVTAGIVGFFNDITGGFIIIQLSTNAIIHVGPASSSAVWNKNVDVLIQTSLTEIYQRAQQHGEKVDINSVSADLTTKLLAALIAIGAGGDSVNGTEGFQYLIQIGLLYSAAVKIGILKIITKITTVRSIEALVAIFQAIALLVGEIDDGINVLIQNKVELDFSIISGAGNAIEAFIYILVQIHKYVHFRDCFSRNFFTFLALLGGNSTSGVNGVITIVAAIQALINHRTTIDVVIALLLKFGASQSNGGSLSTEWSGAVQQLLSVIAQFNLGESLSGIVTIFKSIQGSSWSVSGINISAIIKLLVTLNSGALRVIVAILVALQTVVEIKLSILALIGGLVRLLATAGGALILAALVHIAIDISALDKIRSDILAKLGASITIVTIIGVLLSLSVLGAVFKALVTALTSNHLDLLVIIRGIGIEKLIAVIRASLTVSVTVGGGGGGTNSSTVVAGGSSGFTSSYYQNFSYSISYDRNHEKRKKHNH